MTHLRLGTVDDAKALAVLAEHTFRDTFAAMNDPVDLRLHCEASYGETQQRAELTDHARTIVLAVDEGALIGFAQVHWSSRTPSVTAATPAELQRLYVSRPWHGRGVAQALMAEVLGRAKVNGADQLWLGVWEHNPRALAFYRKHGFVEVGAHVFQLGRDPQRDLILVRPVAA